jgi:hypothetical protein
VLSQGKGFAPEVVASTPALGPTEASRGLAAAGDVYGDAVIAWVQGTGAATQIVAAQLWEPPGGFGPIAGGAGHSGYVRTARPVVAWSASRERWGQLTYPVTVDGVPIGQTTATSARLGPLSDGPHVWQVTAVNHAGGSTAARPVRLFVDTVAPTLSFTLSGALRTGSVIRLSARYADLPPSGLPSADASGVGKATVDWGDGTRSRLTQSATNVYARSGRYRVKVVVTDRAGNATTVIRTVTIVKPAKPRKRRR